MNQILMLMRIWNHHTTSTITKNQTTRGQWSSRSIPPDLPQNAFLSLLILVPREIRWLLDSIWVTFKESKISATVLLEPAEKTLKVIRHSQKTVNNDMKEQEFMGAILFKDRYHYDPVECKEASDLQECRLVRKSNGLRIIRQRTLCYCQKIPWWKVYI